MAVNQTAALKVGLCLLAFHGRISSLQPHFQHLPTLPLRLLLSASSHNPRCREKQRKEASRLQTVNRKLTAMNKLLMEENDRLQKQVSQLVYENNYFCQQTQNTTLATTDTSCESVVTSGQHHLTPQHPPRDASSAGLVVVGNFVTVIHSHCYVLFIPQETLTEFLSKATGTAIEWVQMPGMKPGLDSIGIVAISHGRSGVAARACGLVGLDPTRVTEILKDRPSWYRDCQAVDVINVLSTGNGGTIELLYMQFLLVKFAKMISVTVSKFWRPDVTHVIASTDENGACTWTLKVLMAILNGKRVLKLNCQSIMRQGVKYASQRLDTFACVRYRKRQNG
ncbi:hypothetical protein E1A91_A06G145200v1 [Gossypium mustelinum]|uniref:START domain-containing protein n=1 Tax=Gossypium mustelinum TaxID=34275 RepID=A0A5D2YXL4_GOSMU|nr:hypothetical protein E1A91_A06G145200v1 [Gossypium mustelinum]